MSVEYWKPIRGYEGLYDVSDQGDIRRSLSYSGRGLKAGRHLKKKRHNSGNTTNKYHVVGLSKNGKPEWFLVHRLVANAWINNPAELPHVNHKNGIRADNRAGNLEYVTPKENTTHAIKSGLMSQRGEDSQVATHTDQQVELIIAMLSNGINGINTARLCGETRSFVSMIKNAKAWTHLPRPANMKQPAGAT